MAEVLSISKTSKYSIWSLPQDNKQTVDCNISSKYSKPVPFFQDNKDDSVNNNDIVHSSTDNVKIQVQEVTQEVDEDLNSALTMLGGSFAM